MDLPQAIFLDRDGTLIADRHFLSDPAGVELIAGVRETLCALRADGCLLFLLTNQSGVGRGLFPLESVERCNQRMLELLDLPPPGFTKICIAPETPEMPVVYRKPSPRFILEMMARYSLDPAATWMVGDRLSDVQTGLNAGVQAAILSVDEAVTVPPGVWRCRDLPNFYERLKAGTER